MKRMKLTTLTLATLALSLLACDPATSNSQTDTGESDTSESDTSDTTETDDTKSFELAYLSGHLGNTWDCPGDGVPVTSASKADEAGEAGADFAPCEDGDSNCGGPLNCEKASLVMKLKNTGEVSLSAFSITEIELLDMDGNHVADLSVVELDAMMEGDTLSPGAEVTLRVQITAPESNDIGYNWSGKLRVIVVTEEGANGELTTPEVQGLGMIAT
ncbi:MAG: archaellum component FlaG (FlaF/FlaG flagellin family) [Myxococcota bacterium]|jgi:archaellum component FlaG (FlaF/FlaG flagellin family)